MKPIKLPVSLAIAMMLPFIGAMTAHAQFDQDQTQESTNPETQITRTPAPLPDINKDMVGWQEAGFGTNGGRISSTLRANWVMLNESNGIDGQVVGISSPIDVYLLRNGFVAGQTTTAGDGSFQLTAASPGTYTIVGYSPEAIFTYSFNAVANDGESTNQPTSIQTLPVLGEDNNRLITKLVQEYSPEVKFPTLGKYDVGETDADPAQYYGWSGLQNLQQETVPSTSIQSHEIGIVDGRVVGRVHQMNHESGRPIEVVNTRIMLIRNGEVASEAQVDDLGVFHFQGVTAGTYGLVAVGEDGLTALGMTFVNQSSANDGEETTRNDRYDPLFRTVSLHQDLGPGSSVIDITLSSPDSVGWFNNFVTEQAYINAMNQPLPGAPNVGQIPANYFDGFGPQGFGDPGFFGGSGGAGPVASLGGFGNLLLPIGIGGVIYEAIDENDNSNLGNFNQPPTSPF